MWLEGGDDLTMRAVGAGIDGGPSAQQKKSSAMSSTSGEPACDDVPEQTRGRPRGPSTPSTPAPEEKEAVDRNTGQAVTLALLHTRVHASSSTSLGHSSHHNHMVARKTNMQILNVGE